jgi:hypothetical protein
MVEGKYLDRVYVIKKRLGQIKVNQLRKSLSTSDERIRKDLEFLHLTQENEDRENINTSKNEDFVNVNMCCIKLRSQSLEGREKRRKKPQVFTYPKTITTGAKYIEPIYEASESSSSSSSSSEDESDSNAPLDSNEEKRNLSAIVAKFKDTKMIIIERLGSSTRDSVHNA